MAANHIAMVRSSARAANLRSNESTTVKPQCDINIDSKSDELSGGNTTEGNNFISSMNINNDLQQSLADELSQMSVISISSGLSTTTTSTKPTADQRSSEDRRGSLKMPMVAKLRKLETVADIDDCLDVELSQDKILDNLERNWKVISEEFARLVEHLTQRSREVSLASESCLESLLGSIELTCDKVDGEMKALYQLMSKCDELTTKLSIASNFREEIKTLKNSVDTLEALYRNRPKKGSSQDMLAQRRRILAATSATRSSSNQTTEDTIFTNLAGSREH